MKWAALALALALGGVTPASSHCFSVWHYRTPQHCGVKTPDHSWFVEVVPPTPPLKDERSAQETKDQAEHDAALKAHHDELNLLLTIEQNEEHQ